MHEIYLKHQSEGSCYGRYGGVCSSCIYIEHNPSKFSCIVSDSWHFSIIPFGLLPIAGLVYLWLRSYEMTVTDKRIYGKTAFGKRVDLPIDSVSATATTRFLKGISVSTSSGRISFLMIRNVSSIYKIINDLLLERQQKKVLVTNESTIPTDEITQIKKYKELLDSGIISQEEFDAKKKQLLGL